MTEGGIILMGMRISINSILVSNRMCMCSAFVNTETNYKKIYLS